MAVSAGGDIGDGLAARGNKKACESCVGKIAPGGRARVLLGLPEAR